MRLRWLLIALGLSVVLAGTNLYAMHSFLYWRWRWFDTPMHLLAGVVMGTAAVGVLKTFRPYAYLITIVVGAVGWELFEHYFGLTSLKPAYAWDSYHDVLNDALGAIAVYIYARYTIWRSN
jgi:hypothetical protein